MDKKIIIIPVLLFVGVMVWFFLILTPINKQMSILENRLETLREKEKQRISVIKFTEVETQVQELTRTIQQSMERFYAEEELIDLGKIIDAKSRPHGLKLISVTPDYASLVQLKEAKEISELPIEIVYEGRFLQLASLLDDLDTFPFAMRIEAFSFAKTPEKKNVITMALECVIIIRQKVENNLDKPSLTHATAPGQAG